jgi:hypothetical protein
VLLALAEEPGAVLGNAALQLPHVLVPAGQLVGAGSQLADVAAPQVVPEQAKVAKPVLPDAELVTVTPCPLVVAGSDALQMFAPTAHVWAATAGQPDATGAQVAAVALPQVVPEQAKVAEPV